MKMNVPNIILSPLPLHVQLNLVLLSGYQANPGAPTGPTDHQGFVGFVVFLCGGA